MSHNKRWSGARRKGVKRTVAEQKRIAQLPRQKPLEEVMEMAGVAPAPVLATLKK